MKTNKETNDPLQTMCLYCLLFDLFKFYVINFISQKNVNISFNQWILPYSLKTFDTYLNRDFTLDLFVFYIMHQSQLVIHLEMLFIKNKTNAIKEIVDLGASLQSATTAKCYLHVRCRLNTSSKHKCSVNNLLGIDERVEPAPVIQVFSDYFRLS